MAELQINELSAAATELETLDYFAIDNDVDNTRKILASTLQAKIRNNLSDAELATLNGVSATLTAAELNKLDGFTGDVDDLNYLSGVTAGTTAASKALVLNSDGDGGLGRNMTIAGTLEVAGTVDAAGLLTAKVGIDMTTGDLKMNGNDLILDANHDSKFAENIDNVIDLHLNGASEYRWDAAAFGCSTGGANNLGGALSPSTSASAANAWNDLNLKGHISMGGITTPSNPAIDESMKIYFDSSDGGLKVLLRHGGVTKPFTLQAFV